MGYNSPLVYSRMTRKQLCLEETLELFEQSDDDFSDSGSEYVPERDKQSDSDDSGDDNHDSDWEVSDDSDEVSIIEDNFASKDIIEDVAECSSTFEEPRIWTLPDKNFKPRFSLPSIVLPVVTANINRSSSELEIFKKSFPKSLLIYIAQCTNERLRIYNRQKKANIPLTDEWEILIVLGISFVMCYHKLPSLSDYWSNSPTLGIDFIKNAISRNRFQLLLSKMYFHAPDKPADACKDYYMMEVVNCLKDTFRKNRSDSTTQSIDETMVKFKGRSALKQYLPLKPIKRGIKLWLRCDSDTGYCYDFNIYIGKSDNDFSGTLGEKVVFKICESIRQKNTVIACDRFFTSVKLLETLEYPIVGTCMRTRKNVPKFDGKLNRGESEFRTNSNGILAARWIDSKEVLVLSNCHLPENTIVKRKQKDGTKKDVACPEAISLYCKIMGGVDLADQKIGCYDFDRKSTKWWRKVFFKLIMLAAINSHILQQEIHHKKSKILSFLIPLAEQMILTGRQHCAHKRKLTGPGRVSKKAKLMINVGDHLPIHANSRRRCANCSKSGKEKRTKFVCQACQVPLCTPCFTSYHKN